MGRLVKIHNDELLIAHNYVATPEYTLQTADYAGGATPPHGWEYFADDVVHEDFALPWAQPAGSEDSYALGAIVVHNGTRWRSTIAGNVWEPGVSGWTDADSETPVWIQPTGAHDAYVLGAIVKFNGDFYVSVLDANVWAPNVTGWRRTALIAPDGTVSIPAWVQPTGAGDAYALGAQVTHNGQTWTSTIANNVWEPGVFGWVVA